MPRIKGKTKNIRHNRSFWGDGNVLQLNCGDSCTLCKLIKNHLITYSKTSEFYVMQIIPQ